MSTVVYDAAVLGAADRNERRAWAEHRVRLELGILALVPAPVVTQVATALRRKATILTSDPDDMARLVRASGCEVPVVAI